MLEESIDAVLPTVALAFVEHVGRAIVVLRDWISGTPKAMSRKVLRAQRSGTDGDRVK